MIQQLKLTHIQGVNLTPDLSPLYLPDSEQHRMRKHWTVGDTLRVEASVKSHHPERKITRRREARSHPPLAAR